MGLKIRTIVPLFLQAGSCKNIGEGLMEQWIVNAGQTIVVKIIAG